MSPAARQRVMVKTSQGWIRGVAGDGPFKGKTTFDHATAVRVEASAEHRGQPAYIADIGAQPSPEDTLRARIVAVAKWGAAHEPQIHYTQDARRMTAIAHAHRLPLYTDCSGFATLAYSWAGAPDPNGRNYNGTGYTGTLLAHMREVPIGKAKPGDLIVYGDMPGKHVVIVVVAGTDPQTVSHGQERGPFVVRHSVEAAAHHGARPHALTLPSWAK